MLFMRHFALLRPTELAHLAQLSERHEELMQQLAGLETRAAPNAQPDTLLGARELQIEIRQLRQEALKVLSTVQGAIERLP
jgi:hypothetical protein